MADSLHIALTGATGFLGSHLTDRLMRDGHRVSALVRDPSRLEHLPIRPSRVVTGDVRDGEKLRELAHGAEAFIHLVSNFRTASDSAEAHWATNVEGTRNALDAASEAGVRRFIHCSTIGVHGHVKESPASEEAPFDPGDLYQETKLAAERLVRERMGTGGMEIVVIRPTSMYGPGDLRMLKMFRMLASRTFLLLGPCTANFHPVYIDDVVDGFVLAMREEAAAGETFFIGGPEYLPLREYVFEAARAVGAPRPWLRLPYWPVYLAGALCESICVPLGVEPPLHRRRVRFFRNNRAFSIEKARRLLGYDPEVSLREGMRRTVESYRRERLVPLPR